MVQRMTHLLCEASSCWGPRPNLFGSGSSLPSLVLEKASFALRTAHRKLADHRHSLDMLAIFSTMVLPTPVFSALLCLTQPGTTSIFTPRPATIDAPMFSRNGLGPQLRVLDLRQAQLLGRSELHGLVRGTRNPAGAPRFPATGRAAL